MRTFANYVENLNSSQKQIHTEQAAHLYDKVDFALTLALEWDQMNFRGKLFERVTTVANLTGQKFGLFNSSLGKPDPKIILSSKEAKAFPNQQILQKYPQLDQPQVLKGYTIMINVKLILEVSSSDLEAVKRIGGVAIHEATHASEYIDQSGKGSVSLTENLPEQNRKAFENWFDQNVNQIASRLRKNRTWIPSKKVVQ